MISCDSAEIQTDSEDDSAMFQKGIFHEGMHESLEGFKVRPDRNTNFLISNKVLGPLKPF